MVQTVDSNPQPEFTPPRSILLENIWRIFALYDRSAKKAQSRFIFLRKLILILSVVATTLAIIESIMKSGSHTDIFKLYPNNIFLYYLLLIIHYFVIITPITVSVLLAGSVKFGRGINWILLRASAETIKQEIYRYRTQVGVYSDPNLKNINFAKEIQTIGERLMKTQVNQSSLAWDDAMKRSISQSEPLLAIIKEGISPQDQDPLSPLTAEQYIKYRLEDQLIWYRGKTRILDQQWQILQWLIYILGGVGTFLAAIQQELWIAVSNAVSASLLSFLEFRRLDATLVGYNQTATNLENILCWWHSLTPESKDDPKNREKLVKNSEKVIRAETTGWVQEMRDAMAKLYKEEEPPKKDEDSIEGQKEPPKENEDPSNIEEN